MILNNCEIDIRRYFIYAENIVTAQNRSERNRVDRKNMIQECKNPIARGNFKWIFAW